MQIRRIPKKSWGGWMLFFALASSSCFRSSFNFSSPSVSLWAEMSIMKEDDILAYLFAPFPFSVILHQLELKESLEGRHMGYRGCIWQLHKSIELITSLSTEPSSRCFGFWETQGKVWYSMKLLDHLRSLHTKSNQWPHVESNCGDVLLHHSIPRS